MLNQFSPLVEDKLRREELSDNGEIKQKLTDVRLGRGLVLGDEVAGTAVISGSIYPMQSRGSKGLGRVGSETAGNFGEMEFLAEQPG